MRVKKPLLRRFKNAIFGVLFAIVGIFGALSINTLIAPVNTAYATPATETTDTTKATTEPSTSEESTESAEKTEDSTESTTDTTADTETCQSQVGALAFIICPGTGTLSQAVDSIYSQIEKLLKVEPISFNSESPIFQIWQIMRDITNIVFVIMILVVIYSQLTGVGISNYGIKKALPKIIVAALLVNLSYIICAAGVDISNITGSGLRGLFEGIQTTAINNGGLGDASMLSWSDVATAMIGGGAIAGVSIGLAGGLGAVLFPFLAAVLGAVISVVIGLFMLGLRQALISMLVMISPIAFVCYLLPNTEKWFGRWKDAFFAMLFFYPMFSLLYGASQLAGWALIASSVAAGSLFGIIVGLAVQVIPLILSISLMKMSGTMLGKISGLADKLADKPRGGLRDMAQRRAEIAKGRRTNDSIKPTARLRRYMENRAAKLDLENENEVKRTKARSMIYAQRSILGTQKYDPAFVDEYKTGKDAKGNRSKNRIRTTAATRAAKEAMNLELQAQTAAKDTAHVLSNYGDYHHSTATDKKLAGAAGKDFLNFYRANLTEEFDNFADEDFVIGQYDKYRQAYDDKGNALSKEKEYLYKHYITGAAGALGSKGDLTVLGAVIARSAANEAKRRSYTDLTFKKWGYPKGELRNMIVGYYNDDNGFATDKNGDRLYVHKKDDKGNWILDKDGSKKKFYERIPGEFLQHYPEVIAKYGAYDTYDIDPNTGKKLFYYEMLDKDGASVAKIYKSDGPAMKEILSNWDMPISDPINMLYSILAGNPEGTWAKYGLEGVGLGNLSTTLSRAFAPYKEKNNGYGPMMQTSIAQGYIKNASHVVFDMLENISKTGKPGNFNVQDGATFEVLAYATDPDNWEELLFTDKGDPLGTRRNVNGEKLKGLAISTNPDGSITEDDVSHDKADKEQLKNKAIDKFFNGSFGKMTNMMAHITPNVIDNQKPSAQKYWSMLYSNLLGLSEIAENAGLVPDPFPIDPDTMTPEQIKEAEEKNAAAKEARIAKRKEIFGKYPALKDPLATDTNDTLSKASDLNTYFRKKRNKQSDKKKEKQDANNKKEQAATPQTATPTKLMREAANRANGINSAGSTYLSKEALAKEQAIMNDGYEDANNEEEGDVIIDKPSLGEIVSHIEELAATYSDMPQQFCEKVLEYLTSYEDVLPELGNAITNFESYTYTRQYSSAYTTEKFKEELLTWIPSIDY